MAAYLGSRAEKVAYKGILSREDGFVFGEIPAIPGVDASGMTVEEVKATMQGLLEEHIEAIVDDDGVLPDDASLDKASGAEVHVFHVLLPHSVRRSAKADADINSSVNHQRRAVQYKAVILQDKDTMLGHFPDLPDAFTSGRTIAEVQPKLQSLLETYVGLMLRSGEALPRGRFAQASELKMTEKELAATPIVGLPIFTINVPA